MPAINWEIFLNLPFNIVGLLFTYWFANRFQTGSLNKFSSLKLKTFPNYNHKYFFENFSYVALIITILFLPLQSTSQALYFPIAIVSIYIMRICVEINDLNVTRNYKRLRFMLYEGVLLSVIALQMKFLYGHVDPVTIMAQTLGLALKPNLKLLVNLISFISLFYLLLRIDEDSKSIQTKRNINSKIDVLWSYCIKTLIIFLFFEGTTPFEILEEYIRNSRSLVIFMMILSFLTRLIFLEGLIYLAKFSLTKKFFGRIENRSEKTILALLILSMMVNIWS